MKKRIDFKTWPRYQHYLFFKDYELPRYNMTFPMDVTKLYSLCKRKGYRFYFYLMHTVMMAMNQIENFRYRIENKNVFDEPIEHVSFTDLIEGTDLFKMVFTKVHSNFVEFERTAIETSKKQGAQLINISTEQILNTVYITSFPWAKFTHFTHATRLSSTDSVPRVSWSQFVEENGKKILNLSVEVHHGLVDGYHLGLLINQLQKTLNEIN